MMIDLPGKYKNRIVPAGSGLRVYGDTSRIVMLGVVCTQHEAMQLLDGYDGQLTRRTLIAEKALKGNEENEDAKQITERLKHDVY